MPYPIPVDTAASVLEDFGPPPGLIDGMLGAEALQQQNVALARENDRLAEENAKLMRARLEQEHALLTQENAILQMQMQQAQQAMETWGTSLPLCKRTPLRLPQQAYIPQSTRSQAGTQPPGCLRKEARTRRKWSGLDPSDAGHSARTSTASTAAGSESSSSFNKSRASTDDSEDVEHTTVMMRNIPNNYTRTMILELIDKQGFEKCYNLVYLPIDFNSDAGFGYAFINLVSPEEAERFRDHFQGFNGWTMTSEKVCDVMWSGVHQGLEAHIERYRNSPVMHPSVPDEFKPVVFENGVRIPFPAPTKLPRAPRIRRRQQA
jgi:hypothetical protein